MCGRMATYYQWKDIEEEFDIDKMLAEFKPHFNVAPSQKIPVIIHGSNAFDMFRWGLLPHWAKDAKMAMINAKAETLSEKPSFKEAFLGFRCLVPVSGFYEWGQSKIPHYIQVKDKSVFALAGIASRWTDPTNGETINTCCIITTEANSFMKKIHHRMPAIITEENYKDWIDPEFKDIKKLSEMLKPFDEKMSEYEISKLVNSPINDDSRILDKIEKQGSLNI